MASTLSPVCRWRSEAIPDFEVRIERYIGSRIGIKATLYNRSTKVPLHYKVEDEATPIFQRCVWKWNDFPYETPLETRLFRNLTNKSAILIGIDLKKQEVIVKYFKQFNDDILRDHACFFVPAKENETSFQPLTKPNTELFDAQAEKGMIRPTTTGEQEVVHIWDQVGHNGISDLRLLRTSDHSTSGELRETLTLELFNRALWTSLPLDLKNQNTPLTDPKRTIDIRIMYFKSHPVAHLEGRIGDAYTGVTLSSMADAPTEFQGFLKGKNLQSIQDQEIAEYVREQLFVIKDANHVVVSAVSNRARVEVMRKPDYDFGAEHGKLDAICIHLSQHLLKDIALPFCMIVSFFSGMFNSDAPKIHQLQDLDEGGMKDLLQENPGLVTPLNSDRRAEIFAEYDRAIGAGADVNYYIAINRKTARFEVGSISFKLRSAATFIGRVLALRPLWESEPSAPNPNSSIPATAAEMFTRAATRATMERDEKESNNGS